MGGTLPDSANKEPVKVLLQHFLHSQELLLDERPEALSPDRFRQDRFLHQNHVHTITADWRSVVFPKLKALPEKPSSGLIWKALNLYLRLCT